ncbi:MAG: Rrf2 family transcriptional regulator [Acidobacteriota bacterium]
MVNTRLSVAIHVLTLLALRHPEPATSEFIAGSVNTNPVVIRRILARLREAGLVASRPGVKGGWNLARDPEGITLADIYRAVRSGDLLAVHPSPNPQCPVGRSIQGILGAYYRRAERVLEAELERATVTDLLREATKV